MKRLNFLMLIFLLNPVLWAQNNEKLSYTDSLKHKFHIASDTDAKIAVLEKLSKFYSDEYPDDLSEFVDYLTILTKDSLDHRIQAHVWYFKARSMVSLGDQIAGLELFEQARNSFWIMGDSLNYLKATRNRGLIYSKIGKQDSAEYHFVQSLATAENIGNKYFQVRSHRSLGHTLLYRDRYYEAIDHFKTGVGLAKEIEDTLLWADNLSSVGNVYFYLEEFRKMADYSRKSLELLVQTNQEVSDLDLRILMDNHNIGIALVLEEQYEEARNYIMKADSMGKVLGKPQPNIYNTLGHLYLKTGERDSAEYYLRKTIAYGREQEDDDLMVAALNGMAELFMAMEKFDSAAILLEENIQKATEIGQDFYLSEALLRLSQVENERGNYKLAYDYFQKHHALSDSLINESKIREITTLENRYTFENEKRQLAQQQKEKELLFQSEISQRKVIQQGLVAGLILVMIVMAVIIRFYQTKTKDNRRIKDQSEQLQNANKDLVQLSNYKQGLTQMIAHDMKNPLNVIISLAQNSSKDEDLKEVVQSAQMMLQMVNNMLDIQRFEETKMQLELNHFQVQNLILKAKYQVELLMMAKSIKFESEVPHELTVFCDKNLTIRILVNLFTNAIKYLPIDGKLIVNVHENDGRIHLEISDTGKGISEELQDHIFDKFWQSDPKKYGMTTSNGLGLTFCKMAVMAHGGDISVTSQSGEGATFCFDLALGEFDKVEELPEIVAIEKETSLSVNERKLIERAVQQLRSIPIYKSSKIEEILKGLSQYDSPGLENWKRKLREASYSFDNQAFEALLSSRTKF